MKRQNIRKALLIFSFLLFPITIFYFSPFIIINGAIQGVITGSFIVFSLQFVASLFWGRAFCGYVCPVGGMQECLMLISDKKVAGGKKNWIKYFIWTPWIITIASLIIRAGGISGINFFYMTPRGVSLSEINSYFIYYGVILLVVVLALVTGKRGTCHYMCWMAPFMVIGTKLADKLKIPKLHIKAQSDRCTGCGRCSVKCPMSLDVKDMAEKENMKNDECILCGECIDICPRNALCYSFKNDKEKQYEKVL